MSLARSATAFSCLALGLADLLYLNLSMVPALFEEVSGGAAEPASALHREERATEVTTTEIAATETTAYPGPDPDPAPPPVAPVPARAEPRPGRAARSWSVVVHFARDRDDLGEPARARLDRAAARLTADPSTTAWVEGHTDRAGDSAHNLELSQRRAERVADHLVALGVERARMTVLGLGERRPLEHETDASRRDRRVEVRVVAAAHVAPALPPEEDAP